MRGTADRVLLQWGGNLGIQTVRVLRDRASGGVPAIVQSSNRLSDARAVARIGLGAVGDVAFLDVFGRSADLASRILEQCLALSGVHFPEQVTRLLIVVVVDPMVPVGRRAIDRPVW